MTVLQRSNISISLKINQVLFFFITILGVLSNAWGQNNELPSGVYQLDSIRKGTGYPKLEGSTTDLNRFSFHYSTLAPGASNHPLRSLMDRDELVIVIDGSITVQAGDSVKILGPGSIALLVAGDAQRFTNHTKQKASYYVLGFTSTQPVDISRGKISGGSVLRDWSEIPAKKTPKGYSRPVFDKPSAAFTQFETHATTLNAGQESHPQHQHINEEVILMMKGDITMHIGDKYIKAPVGSIALLRSNEWHSLMNTGSEDCWYYAIKWVNNPSSK